MLLARRPIAMLPMALWLHIGLKGVSGIVQGESISNFYGGFNSSGSETAISQTATDNNTQTQTSEPHNSTMRFIKSSNFGNFFMAAGSTIGQDDVNLTSVVPSECSCRVACWSVIWCCALAAELRDDGMYDCKMSDHLPNNVTENNKATYILFVNVLDIKYQVTFRNKEFYLVPNATVTFPEAESYCKRLPGFRLGVFITAAGTEILLHIQDTIAAPIFVDMRKTEAGDMWGDGTLYKDSHFFEIKPKTDSSGTIESEPYYRLDSSSQEFIDTNLNAYHFLCQGYLT